MPGCLMTVGVTRGSRIHMLSELGLLGSTHVDL